MAPRPVSAPEGAIGVLSDLLQKMSVEKQCQRSLPRHSPPLFMRRFSLLILLLASALHAETQITWNRIQLHEEFYSEGAGLGDINGDGKVDIVAGPFWWEGPDFRKKHAYYEPKVFNINGYSDNFFAYVQDFNVDQKNDILILGFPGKEARLYLNPGTAEDKPWPMHIVADVVDNESPVFADITGDGKPEIVCSTGGRFGWFAPNWSKPTEKWPFMAVTDDVKVAKFTHGLGVGDVDGDGKLDLLEARRWWSHAESGLWTQHNFAAGVGGGAQMFAYDFDGNGTQDVFTSLSAHRYGVAVYLQNTKPAANEPLWKPVMLASEHPADNDYGIVFSQPHAASLADINGDGIKDIVTGKRYWAHNGHDPDEHGARVVYWYETKRDGKGGVDFVPHLADAESGVGVDVQVGDVNGDQLPDIVTANKAGVFVLVQKRQEISAAQAEQMRPKKLYGAGLQSQTNYAHGQSAQEALKGMQLPGGFKAELIASEPDIVQPIAMTWDERGRLWVVEGMSYPQPREPGAGKDRIKILEDKDGDGTFETIKVFCEGISLASGIEVGYGGVWVGAAPYFMFIPDADRDDKPDASLAAYESFPKVPGLGFTAYALLDGWGSQDTHETLNSFIWGPDGWLYGCHGVFTHSKVGKPGTPDEQRTPINAGVWRYHPVRHTFEVFAHGSSNPWGLDYDQGGEFFITACVIPHLYHIVPGGRYHRQGGQHFNPYTYEDIKTIADHAHYAGNIRDNAHWGGRDAGAVVQDDTNAAGGGHAHCGLAIYQSSLFPAIYRNALIFGNLHGHRLVSDYLDPHDSTYIGKHGSDFMRSNDMNFVPVTQKVGPDGALYVSDWSDKQVCHRGSNAVELWDRSNGRIYRVSYAGWKPWKGDLSKEEDVSLAQLVVQTENEWTARMARRILFERAASNMVQVDQVLRALASDQSWRTLTLRCNIGASAYYMDKSGSPISPKHVRELTALDSDLAQTRLWGVRLASELQIHQTQDTSIIPDSIEGRVTALASLAKKETSAQVRRELASALQRLPVDQRVPLASALLVHGEDKDDPYIPLLTWYGIEPVVGLDARAALQLARVSKLPQVTSFIYRRMAVEEAGRAGLLTLAAESKDDAQRKIILRSVLEVARTEGKLAMPENWQTIRGSLGAVSEELEAYMDEPSAKQVFRDRLANASLPRETREAALTLLLNVRDGASAKLLQEVIRQDDKVLLRRAVQALGTLYHPETSALLVGKFKSFDGPTQNDVVNTLSTNPEGAKALLTAVKEKVIPSTALSPFLARQLEALKDEQVSTLLKETFGDLNAPKPDLEQRKKKLRVVLQPVDIAKADTTKGHVIFNAICGQCHKLFGEGQNVGPDLTGSNRGNLDYVLDNVLDPNAVIGKDYQLNIFELADGRVASGVVKEESATAFRIVMPGGLEQTITTTEVKKRTVAKVSTMPEGLFDALPAEQLQQLVAYLQMNAAGAKADGSSPATKVEGALEGEALTSIVVTGGKTKPQAMGGFGKIWSSGQQLWWTGAKPGDVLTIPLRIDKSGKYALKAALTKARDYAVIEASLDGQVINQAKMDLYNSPSVIHTGALDWGIHELSAGEHKLTVTITGANPQAVRSYMFGLDYLLLEAQ